jgi:hypothetical protein
MKLTGNFRFRRGLRGKAVLQVEEEFSPFWSRSGEPKQRWRDARLIDLADPSMRIMLDIGRDPLRSRRWALRSRIQPTAAHQERGHDRPAAIAEVDEPAASLPQRLGVTEAQEFVRNLPQA